MFGIVKILKKFHLLTLLTLNSEIEIVLSMGEKKQNNF